MSDDDIDDKIPQSVKVYTSKSSKFSELKEPSEKSEQLEKQEKQGKCRKVNDPLSDDELDDNIEVKSDRGDFDKDLTKADTEIILTNTEKNDDTDKSDSDSSRIWPGIQNENDQNSDGEVSDIDNILSNMHDEPMTADQTFDELSTKIDSLDERLTEVTENVDAMYLIIQKIHENVKAIMRVVGATTIKKQSASNKIKKTIINKDDIDDPVNKSDYFEK